jgi:hypothetical protein
MSKISSFEDIVRPKEILGQFATVADHKERWNKVQLTAAIRLIYHFLGHDWYELVIGRFGDPETMSTRAYRRLMRTKQPPVHPLAQSFWSGQPEEFVRVVMLGTALRVLGCENETNLATKIDELRSSSFAKAYFELKIALTYLLNGFDVKFLEPQPQKGIKTPDFSISKYGLKTVVECKKRETTSAASLDTRVKGVLDRLDEAHAQIAAFSSHGVVCIEVEDNLDFANPTVKAYSDAIQTELPIIPEVTCVMLTWEKILVLKGNGIDLATGACGIPNRHPRSLLISPIPAEALCNPAELELPEPYCVIAGLENAPRIEIEENRQREI